jgi:hypothetical protein
MDTSDLKEILSANKDAGGNDVSLKVSGELCDDSSVSLELWDEPVIDDFLPTTGSPKKDDPSVYDREWVKLERGIKLNRLQLFVNSETDRNNLTPEQRDNLKNIVFKLCNDNLLNKVNIVVYENELVSSIKILDFDGIEYTTKRQVKKVRTTPKSKSNIDRLFKKNKR